MSILSNCFLPKTLIHLWNFSGTSFFASTSDLAASSSLSQISYSFTTFFTSIVLSCFCFFFLFSFFSSCFLPTSSLASSSFCFCHHSFPCFGLHYFPYSSGHLIILTPPVLQLISGLWQASHDISKITIYFCPSMMLIFILSLCSW